jgi:hypothetical protein
MTTKNPNAILRRIRTSVATLSRGSPAAVPSDVHQLIQSITDLDNHLSWGGAPPDDWCTAPLAPPTKRVFETAGSDEPDPVEDIIRRM